MKKFLNNMNPFSAAAYTCFGVCFIFVYLDRLFDLIYFIFCTLICATIGNALNELRLLDEEIEKRNNDQDIH